MRQRFMAALRDREGQPPAGQLAVRMLEKTPKNALRLRFMAKVFPDARFIYLHRDVRQTMGSMIDGWESGNFRMYHNLPGWVGPIWSFLLTPEWQHLSGMPLGAIVAGQWRTTTEILLDDLSRLEPDRWLEVDHEAFVSDPQAQIERVCAWAGLDWDRNLAGASLPLSRYTLTRPESDKWRRHAEAIEDISRRCRKQSPAPWRLPDTDAFRRAWLLPMPGTRSQVRVTQKFGLSALSS